MDEPKGIWRRLRPILTEQMPHLIIRVRHEGCRDRGGINVVSVESHQVLQHVRPQQDVALLFNPPDQFRHFIVKLVWVREDRLVSTLNEVAEYLRLVLA